MADLEGKSVLITGASRGIGAAAARAFVDAGARVMLTARSTEALDALAAEIGDAAQAQSCDVSVWDDVEAAVAGTVKAFGSIDILINNAGVIEPIGSVAEMNPQGWGAVIDINLKGVFYGLRAALPRMLANSGGTIITISSGAAHNPLEGWSHYCASKAGAAMLNQVTDLETRGHGIRIMGLSPGTVATEMQVQIKASGINRVSALEWSDHIPPEWPARALVWMCTAEADDLVGTELSLRDPEIRRRVGLST